MSEFEQWYADNKDKLHLTDRIAAKNVWQAAKQSMQGESIPAGFALVPIKETKAIRLVVEQEDWEWRDVLAAAGSITEDEFNSPDYVETIADLQAENEAFRKDAELGKLVRQKMTSGNDVPVSRCTITSIEVAAISAAISKGGA